MKRSVLLRRVFAVVILSLMITVIFASAAFVSSSESVFAQIKEQELLPRARAVAKLLVATGNNAQLRENMELFAGDIAAGDSILGAYMVAVDPNGQIVIASDGVDSQNVRAFDGIIQYLLSGQELYTVQHVGSGFSDVVIVGVPAYAANGVTVMGAVMLFVPLYEATAALGTLARSMALSLLLVTPIVCILVYAVVYRIVRPLQQMRDVALFMAEGNFDVRANDRSRGEVGQLGMSLNRLARELKHSIAALTLERNRLKQVLNGLSEGILAVDDKGNITHYNPALSALFGTRAAYHLGDPNLALLPDEGVWADFSRAMETGDTVERQFTSGEKSIRMVICPLSDGGKIAGAVGLFSDITQSERLEKTRRDYVANVSHELRTPLTAMRGLVEPLRDGLVKTEEARQRYYDIILRETMRLSRLINDLMELSRLQSGAYAFTPEAFRLDDMLMDLHERYQSIAAEHDITFTVSAELDKLPAVYSNPDRVEQLIVILVDNAIKYTPAGGSVTLCAVCDPHGVIVSVRDTGIGIAEKDLPYVFDRFYKVDKAHSGMGSGLGLSIAKEMLTQMGEKIWVESAAGGGSVFSFTLKRSETQLAVVKSHGA